MSQSRLPLHVEPLRVFEMSKSVSLEAVGDNGWTCTEISMLDSDRCGY